MSQFISLIASPRGSLSMYKCYKFLNFVVQSYEIYTHSAWYRLFFFVFYPVNASASVSCIRWLIYDKSDDALKKLLSFMTPI